MKNKERRGAMFKDQKVQIRDYEKNDAKELVDIYYNTIHNINIKDYTQKQIDAWAPKSSLDLERWLKKWNKLQPIVATIDNKIVGFAEFDESTGYIDCFYCHHEYIGIGGAIMQAIFLRSEVNKVKRIYTNASITAFLFFQSKGFKTIKEQIVECNGVNLKNFVMERIFK